MTSNLGETKKSLVICGPYPFPENSGTNIRTMNFVRFFQKYGPVDLAYSIKDFAIGKNEIFAKEYYLDKEPYPKRAIKRMSMLLRGLPYPISGFEKPSERLLLEAIQATQYDSIIVRYESNVSSLFKLAKGDRRKVILDFDDVLSDSLYEGLFGVTKSRYKKLLRKMNKKLLRGFEKRCLAFGACLFCSEEDRRRIGGSAENTFVVPNIFANREFEKWDFGNGYHNGNILLFVGSLMYKPNVEGLSWFINSIYPAFKRKYSDGRLFIVGRTPTKDVENLCQNEGIRLYADVGDLRAYYQKCRAVIVPILSGGGTRIKILEASLAHRPVLTTRKGMEGMAFEEDTDLLIFKDEREFVSKYGQLFEEEKYKSIVGHAEKKVLEKYSNEGFQRAMGEVLKKMEAVSMVG